MSDQEIIRMIDEGCPHFHDEPIGHFVLPMPQDFAAALFVWYANHNFGCVPCDIHEIDRETA